MLSNSVLPRENTANNTHVGAKRGREGEREREREREGGRERERR